jgi:hypothetical protein
MIMKRCSICGLEKDYSEFHKDVHQKDGYKNQCRRCRSHKRIRKQVVKENHKLLDKSISRSIYRSFKNKKKGYIWERVIGITFDELKQHLENQFDDIMCWDNYGSYWVIDKIIPTSMYRYSDRVNNEFLKAWSIKNFRPYPRVLHNRRKEKLIWEVIDHYKLYDILPVGLLGDTLWINKNL